ncbi:MAG TPA: mechanosensitive ion channel domain-containing protein, partial [bacterium]
MTDLVQGALGNWVPAALHPVIGTGLEMFFIFCLGLLLTWTIRVFFRRINGFVIRMDGRLESMTPDDARRINTLLDVVQTFVVLLLWGIVAVMMLGQAGVNIGPILAGAGIVGVALGFGAQHLVRDLISGFFIIMENHIRLGDVAVINGTSGMVERITYRVIVLRDMAGVVHVFPHGQINTLANMTKDYSYALMDIRVGYKEHPDRVMTVLKGEAAAMAAEAEWAKAGMTGAEVL